MVARGDLKDFLAVHAPFAFPSGKQKAHELPSRSASTV